MLEGAGFKVINLGRDVAPEKFVAAVKEHDAQIVGISALMTHHHARRLKRTIDALEKAGLRAQVQGDDRGRAGEPGLRGRGSARTATPRTPRSRWCAPKELLGRAGERLMATRPRGLGDRGARPRAGERLIFDGGYGTALFDAGLENGDCPELWERTRIPTWCRASTAATSIAGSPARRDQHLSGAPRSSCTSTTSGYGHDMGGAHPRAERQGPRAPGSRGLPPRAATWPARSGPPATCRSTTGVGKNVATDEEYFETFREQAQGPCRGWGWTASRSRTMMFPLEAAAAIPRLQGGWLNLPVMATMFFQYEELHDPRPQPCGATARPTSRASSSTRGADNRGDELRGAVRTAPS